MPVDAVLRNRIDGVHLLSGGLIGEVGGGPRRCDACVSRQGRGGDQRRDAERTVHTSPSIGGVVVLSKLLGSVATIHV